MKFKPLLLAMMLSVPSVVFAQVLDFKGCVEATLNQNPEMDVSHARQAQAQAALSEANAHRLPQITLSMRGSRSDDALNVFGMKLQQRQVTSADFYTPDLNNPNAYNDFNTRIEMLIPVWNGGKVSSYQAQAKRMITAAQHGNEAVKQYLIFNVYQAYEGVHAAEAYIGVAKKAVAASKLYVKTTRNLVKQGVLVKSELLTAEVHLSQANVVLAQAKNKKQIALDSLKMLMAVNPDDALEVGKDFNLTVPAKTPGALIALSTNQNPKLEAKREEALSSDDAVGVVEAGQYPSFNLMARNDWHDENLGFKTNSYTVAAVASWKLTDFGATSSAVDQAQAVANQKKASVRAEENKVRLQILQAWRNLQVSYQQEKSQRKAIGQAEEAQRLVTHRYQNGISTMTEVLTSQTQLDKTRADLVKTLYEQNIYKAKLRLATGTLTLNKL